MCQFRLLASAHQEPSSKPFRQRRDFFGLEAMEELVKTSSWDLESSVTSLLPWFSWLNHGYHKRLLLPQLLVENPREGLCLAGWCCGPT